VRARLLAAQDLRHLLGAFLIARKFVSRFRLGEPGQLSVGHRRQVEGELARLPAAYGGLRAGEHWALKVPRVNLLKRRLEVVESLSEVRRELVVGPTKTRNRRTVSLPSFLADMIGKHVGDYPSREGYIFTAAEGGPVRHHNFVLRDFSRAAREAGMPEGLRFHDLRHTCAAILTSQGWNPKQIQSRLGHASIRTTLDRYGHLFEGHDAELLTRLDDLAAENRG
jgi:integrase